MCYIYVNTEKDKDLLINKGLKIVQIQEYKQQQKTWVFEYNPSLFNLSEDKSLKQKFYVTDKLIMFFDRR